MSTDNVARLAETLKLTRLAKGDTSFGAAAVGMMDGFPVLASWTRVNRTNALVFLVRFRKGTLRTGTDLLEERVATSPELLSAISKSKLPSADRKSIRAGEDCLRLDLHWSLKAPAAETAAAALRVLQRIVADSAEPIGSTCEECGGTSGELYCVNSLPTSICASCREREGEEGRRRAEAYANMSPNVMMGTAAGLFACLVMALLWGGVAYASDRIWLYGAILMGVAIAWAVNRGMGKVNTYGRALAIVLTLGAVILGDYIFILLSVAKQMGAPVGATMAHVVAQHFVEVEFGGGSTGWMSLLFGAVGAVYILWKNRPPALQPRMVPITPTAS